MKQKPAPHRLAIGLLLAASAIPFTALSAQDTTAPAAEPPAAVETAPPPAAEPAPTPRIEVPPVQAEPVAEAPAAPAEATPPVRRTTTVRQTRTVRTPVRAPAPAPIAVAPAAPAAVAVAPPVAAPADTIAADPGALPPETIDAAPAAPADTVAPAPQQQNEGRTSILPFVLIGALLLAAIAFFALRRRRSDDVVYDEVYDTPAPIEPVAAAPLAAAPLAAATGRPEIALQMNPVRAGVAGNEAIVEFELVVDNQGSAPAEDVRVTTWMFAAGESEMERQLIERDGSSFPEVTIGAGDGKRIQAKVALPTSDVEGDAVLPVVVADAHYRLPDGSEGHSTARFAVGVPDGADLAYFSVDNPSGLHDTVEARPR
jgi:hypothetical protein